MLSLAPMHYAVRRSLSARRALADMASRTWLLEKESTQRVRQAVYLEHTLGRATAAGMFSDLADQYNLIAARDVTHLPITAYLLKDASLVGGSLYLREYREPLVPAGGFRPRDLLAPRRLKRAALGCTYFGNMFFGHFWTDDVTLMLLGNAFGELLRTRKPLTPHQQQLLALLQFHPRQSGGVRVDDLIYLFDRAQNRHKQRRYRALRRLFATQHDRLQSPRGVFVFRGSSGASRVLVNERELADALRPHGVIAVYPERMSLAELNRAIGGAHLVMGVEGSQLLHGLYNAAEGASFLTLQPPMRFSNILKSYTDCLDMHYGFVIGEPCEGGYRVALDEVLQVMDLLEKRSRS